MKIQHFPTENQLCIKDNDVVYLTASQYSSKGSDYLKSLPFPQNLMNGTKSQLNVLSLNHDSIPCIAYLDDFIIFILVLLISVRRLCEIFNIFPSQKC